MGAALLPEELTSVRPAPEMFGSEGLVQVLDDLSKGIVFSRDQPYADFSFPTRHRLRLEIAGLTGADQAPWIDTSALHMEVLDTLAVRLGFDQGLLQFKRFGKEPQLGKIARQTWMLVVRGFTNQMIAEETGRKLGAVRVAKHDVLRSVGAKTAAHAVRRAYELGVLALPSTLEIAG